MYILLKKTCLSFSMDLYVCILATYCFFVFLAPSMRSAIIMNHTILCSDSGNVHKNKHYSGGLWVMMGSGTKYHSWSQPRPWGHVFSSLVNQA